MRTKEEIEKIAETHWQSIRKMLHANNSNLDSLFKKTVKYTYAIALRRGYNLCMQDLKDNEIQKGD